MIIELLKHPLEAGILIALAMYGLILAWTLMARLKWLPGVVARPVRRLLNRLGRLPVLGRAVSAMRRHPLGLGLALAILTGIIVPALLISVYVLFSAIFVSVIMVLAFRYGDWEDEPYEESNFQVYGAGEIVPAGHLAPYGHPDED